MNKRQFRLWKSMVDAIDDFINDKNKDFFDTVGALEGALDASEIKDTKLVRQWFDLWTPLEIFSATAGNKIDKAKVLPYLIEMREFVLKCLGKPPQTERQYKLWKYMIDTVDSYLHDPTQDFSDVVSKLEQALEPAEFTDVDLISQWYDLWKPLDDRRTAHNNQIDKSKATEELNAMKNFLLEHLAEPIFYKDNSD